MSAPATHKAPDERLSHLKKLRRDAAEAALIRDLAKDKNKREIFDRLYQHLSGLADEVEKAMNGLENRFCQWR